jgi:hypothetical protein
LHERLIGLSPTQYVASLSCAVILWLHDQDEPVVPVDETRRLVYRRTSDRSSPAVGAR